MKQFAQKLVKRDYTRRILTIIVAALALFLALAITIPVTLHTQISELRAIGEAREAEERQQEQSGQAGQSGQSGQAGQPETDANLNEDGQENVHEDVHETVHEAKRDDRERALKAALRQLTPVSTGAKIAFATIAVLFLLLGVFYWITVAEWLYKMAVLNSLNRALWPMLGLIFNIFVIPVLLVVLCDPKREIAEERNILS